jgi:hypothetical protein
MRIGSTLVARFLLIHQHSGHFLMDDNSLDTILALIKQLEATLLRLKQVRGLVGEGVAGDMLELLIEESETKLAEIRRKVIQ